MSRLRAAMLAKGLGVLLLGSLVAAAACGDDGAAESGTTQPTGASTTSTGEPAGTEPGEVRPYIIGLLARYDEVTNEIVADPSVALDRDDPLIREYLDLVEPGSEAEGAIDLWVDNAALGITIRPYSDDAPAEVTRLDGEIEPVSEDEVTFPTCVAQNYRQYDGQGRETEFATGQFVPGEMTVVRVEGEWRIRRDEIASNVVGCGGDEV